MPTVKQRIVSTVTAVLLFGSFGIITGYFIAREVTVRVAMARLDQYARQLAEDGEAYSAELRTAMAAVNASGYQPCSTEDIQYFRSLIFESDFLKDAGRMHNGRIECSAVLGRVAPAGTALEPDFIQQDGTLIYKDLPAYRSGSVTAVTEQLGDSFVVFTPLTRMHVRPAPMHQLETLTDAPTQKHGRLLGELPNADLADLHSEGLIRQGENLLATHCSIRFFNCMTAFTTLPEVIATERTRFNGCIVLCGLAGVVIGVLFSFLYRRNKSIEYQLRRAIRKDGLKMVYQPLVELATGRIVGAEALVRWTDEDGTVIAPDVFVRVAEERGFVGEITRFVVARVLREFGPVLREPTGFRVSINVAAADLSDPTFLAMLDGSLARAGVKADRVVIEITEGSTVRRAEAIETIRSLRRRGHPVHIDDFGTGYSSLAYLQDLAVDAIKIDRAFTQAIGTGAVKVVILPQILAMAEALNLKVVVEGVETEQQASYFVSETNPVFVQGWLFGRPVPALDLQHRLAKDTDGAADREAAAVSAA